MRAHPAQGCGSVRLRSYPPTCSLRRHRDTALFLLTLSLYLIKFKCSERKVDKMCLGTTRKTVVKRPDAATDEHSQLLHNAQNFTHIFTESYIETQLNLHRALMMYNLVQDPFYQNMNVSSASRHWMMRHLPHLADIIANNRRITLTQFFEEMERDELKHYFRQKNAPKEMVARWYKLHPPTPAEVAKTKAAKANRKVPAKKRRV